MRFWKFSTSTLSLFNLTCLISSGYDLWMIPMGVKTVSCCCDMFFSWQVCVISGWTPLCSFNFSLACHHHFHWSARLVYFSWSTLLILHNRTMLLAFKLPVTIDLNKTGEGKMSTIPKGSTLVYPKFKPFMYIRYANIVAEFGTYWDLIHSRWGPQQFPM